MQLEVLHLDGGLSGQAQFMRQARECAAVETDARDMAGRVRLWGHNPDLARVKAALPASSGPTLTFYGSGDFHHVSALLIERVSRFAGEPFTVIHFDNHPDWVHFRGGMHCGSWVNRALAVPDVSKVITVGVCSDDLKRPQLKGANLEPLREGRVEVFVYAHPPTIVRGKFGDTIAHSQQGNRLKWCGIADTGVAAFTGTLLSRIGTDAIYITLDKDVLVPEDAITNWDQGRLRLCEVAEIIRVLGTRHRIVGADVTGDFSPIEYAGKFWTIVWRRGESFIDQPRVKQAPGAIAVLNGKTNISLLKTFSEAMQ